MNPKLPPSLAALALALIAGCSSTPPAPHVNYPVTYQVQVGNSQVRSDYGPQGMNVSPTQDVSVREDHPIYYQVTAPISVAVTIYDGSSPNNRHPISQLQGMSFGASVTPSTDHLRFVFSATEQNTSGTLTFTLSDKPIPAGTNPPPPPPSS